MLDNIYFSGYRKILQNFFQHSNKSPNARSNQHYGVGKNFQHVFQHKKFSNKYEELLMNHHLQWNPKEKDMIEFVLAHFSTINPSGIHNNLFDKIKLGYLQGPRGIYQIEESFMGAIKFMRDTIHSEFAKKQTTR